MIKRYENHLIALLAVIVVSYLGYHAYRFGYFLYCANGTYAVNDCMEEDRHTTCERWDTNCYSYVVKLVLEVGQKNYRIAGVYYNGRGNMVGESSEHTMLINDQMLYHPVVCPAEMELYREEF